jgi:hypothetical protein
MEVVRRSYRFRIRGLQLPEANKTGIVHINVTFRLVHVTILPWKSINYYIF